MESIIDSTIDELKGQVEQSVRVINLTYVQLGLQEKVGEHEKLRALSEALAEMTSDVNGYLEGTVPVYVAYDHIGYFAQALDAALPFLSRHCAFPLHLDFEKICGSFARYTVANGDAVKHRLIPAT